MIYRLLAAMAVITSLSACSFMTQGIPVINPDGVGAVQEEEESFLDQMADAIVKAGTPEQRTVRVCLFSAVASEVWVYRISQYQSGPDEPLVAFAGISRMSAAITKLQAHSSSLWFETEMFYAAQGLLRAVEGPLRDRALTTAKTVIIGNWQGIARGLRTSAGQGLLASAMFLDANHAVDRLHKGDLTIDQAWAACKARIDLNLSRARAMAGIDTPPALLRIDQL